MTNPTFSGVIAPVLTPFGSDGTVDLIRFSAFAKSLLADGCTALAPLGTTSEANSISLRDRMSMMETLVKDGVIPSKLMPGTGTCALFDTVTLCKHAVELGVGGTLMLPPFYFLEPDDDGLFRYFSDVIERVGDDRLRVYLYHIPKYTQVGITAGLLTRLKHAFPEVVKGVKDSSGDWSNTQTYLAADVGLEVFPGSEAFLVQGLQAGAVGCISATANLFPGEISAVYHNWTGDDVEPLNARMTGLRKLVQSYALIPAAKAIIADRLGDPDWERLAPPLAPLAPETRDELLRELRLLQDDDSLVASG